MPSLWAPFWLLLCFEGPIHHQEEDLYGKKPADGPDKTQPHEPMSGEYSGIYCGADDYEGFGNDEDGYGSTKDFAGSPHKPGHGPAHVRCDEELYGDKQSAAEEQIRQQIAKAGRESGRDSIEYGF